MKLRDLLIQHETGEYEPKVQITISRPDGSLVTIGPGIRFAPGVELMGVDIATLLDLEVNKSE